MLRVNFNDFYNWRLAWYANRPKGERLGQAFCNHFEETIGRGTYTQKLFYSTDNVFSEKLIYQFFIEFNENFYT